MGLFGGGIEKIEAKGDAARAKGDDLQAYRHFQDALREAERKLPEAIGRLREKMTGARISFVRRKLEEARGFLEDQVSDAAIEALTIARDYLEADDAELQREVTDLIKKAQATHAATAPPDAATIEAEFEDAETDPDAVLEEEADADASREPTADAALAAEASPTVLAGADEFLDLNDADADPEVLFEQLAGALDPDDLERVENLGRPFKVGFVALQRGDVPAAREAFESAAHEHPDDPLLLEHLALAYDQSDRHADAADRYRQALAKDPARWNSRVALAGILAGTSAAGGHPEDAVALLEEGVTDDPPRAASYQLAAAEVLLTLQRPLDALPRIESAMQAGASVTVAAWQLYGGALEGTGRLEEAEEAFDRAVRLGGTAMQPRAQFAEFALRTGRGLKAAGEIIFETCVACQASMPSAQELDYYGFLLTRIQHARGQHRQALEGAERLLARGVSPDVRRVLLEIRRSAKEALARRERPKDDDDATGEAETAEDRGS
jgi:tetratricopeptide (TPR) repeat protein